ncbi:sodium-coupled monocarboxylate transporter 2-like [Mytilus galloprovincialis]|uniref:sodium-coupled monocarboxylate transporter 2-like n=1 Tax=Mytilus galloprovincialis TaxID=29158 RepID=UPI003F7C103C
MWNRTYSYSFERGETTLFHVADYVVFGLTLLVSAGIGLFYAIKDRNINSEKEFLLAGRNLSVFPVSLSLLSSFISAITLLGTPAEIYKYNTMYWLISIGFVISATASAQIFIPVFYNLGITSVFEYIQMRFGRLVRIIACIVYLTWMLFYMSIVLYGPSLALSAVTGISLWGSVVAVGVVCTFYTTLGGMKAVVWTDSFQMLVMFAGMFTLLIAGCLKLGGLDVAWNVAYANDRIQFLIMDFDPTTRHTFWNVIVGGGLFWTAVYGINQAQVQRALSLSSVKKARLAIWLNLPGMFIVLTLVCLVGVTMYSYFSTCDPVTLGIVEKTDQLIPQFTMELVGHLNGLPGLVISCVFSGSLSTISSGYNAIAAILLEDFVKPCFPRMKSSVMTVISKVAIVVCGGVCLLIAYVVSQLGASILQAAYILFGMLGGPLLGLFTLGMLFPWANKWGALIGHLTALVITLWIGLGSYINKVVVTQPSAMTIEGCHMFNATTTTTMPTTPPLVSTGSVILDEKDDFPLYKMSYIWYTGLGMILNIVVGLIVSLVTGPTKPSEINPGLVCPIFDELLPFLPKKLRKKLHFGVRHEDFVKFSPDDPDTKDRGGYDNKGFDYKEADGIKNDKPIATVYNGSPSYAIGKDYEKDFSTQL